MKITKIGYGYTQSLGNYENAKLYAEAEVTLDDGTDPAIAAKKAYQDLKDWVHSRLPDPATIQDARTELSKINKARGEAMSSLSKLEDRWTEAIAILGKHGITVEEKFPWEFHRIDQMVRETWPDDGSAGSDKYRHLM